MVSVGQNLTFSEHGHVSYQIKENQECSNMEANCYDIKPVRKEEGKSYWKIPLCDDDATREK